MEKIEWLLGTPLSSLIEAWTFTPRTVNKNNAREPSTLNYDVVLRVLPLFKSTKVESVSVDWLLLPSGLLFS